MRKFLAPESFICLFTRMLSHLLRTATQCIIYEAERNAAFRSSGYQESRFISLRTIESQGEFNP